MVAADRSYSSKGCCGDHAKKKGRHVVNRHNLQSRSGRTPIPNHRSGTAISPGLIISTTSPSAPDLESETSASSRPPADSISTSDCSGSSSSYGHTPCGCSEFHIRPSSDACSSETTMTDNVLWKEPEVHDKISIDDLERGPGKVEHVILTIGGLKCACCESGVSKAFRHLPAITNPQVNVVLARVEFDLDVGRLTVSEAINQLHRVTGYTFEKYVPPEAQVLELLVGDPTDICNAGQPYGVTKVEVQAKRSWYPTLAFSGYTSPVPPDVSKFNYTLERSEMKTEKLSGKSIHQYTVEVHYDAKQIGARDVFEYYEQLAPHQQLYLTPLDAHGSLGVSSKQAKTACIVFLVSLVLTIPVLVLAWAPVDEKLVYAHISLAFGTAVQVIATKEFFPGALKSLLHTGVFEMDFLIAFSTTTAYVFSVVLYVFKVLRKPLETGSFFETSTLLATLIFLGRVVSEFARLRAAKSVSFRSLQVEDALLVVSGDVSKTRKIDARLLQYGDTIKVPPHTRIVTDGNVVNGGSEVDESMITGETIPVAKGLGHSVYAGTTNGSGQLIIRLTALPHENSVSQIAAMVENAELSKPKIQALADRIAGWFVPIIAAIGVVVFLIWTFVDKYHYHRSWRSSVIAAITYSIATLIVSCPCAIGLAVPMVVLIAGGVSARFGIIFRDPQKLEVAQNATDIVFDKTGTLTTGNLEVVNYEYGRLWSNEVRDMVLGLIKDDKHPVPTAVFKFLKQASNNEGIPFHPTPMEDIDNIPGSGVKGRPRKGTLMVSVGNPTWLGIKHQILQSQHTLLCVTVSGNHCATFRLQDKPRPAAEKVVKALGNRGVNVHMISGDSEGAVGHTAFLLGIHESRSRACLKPGDKQKYIQDVQAKGGVVIFCGDGTNDSVAIKQADVGVSINDGSDVAKSASDVILMSARLHNMLILLDISKAAYRRILTNFGWSATYNIVAVLMAAGAFVKIRIEPAYAALGEMVSVCPVIFIAFQLKWQNFGKKYREMEYEAECN
ncbi:heavy metal translocatin [Lojkania enalia]|uniref:Heavy metal translocatin n=1 Tax=Lojkania enalia TaxID=147567 RepID=A0A9P4K3K6_9PLEO|nr:heavy metal translocatin [Didymosphaeria enalia]